jgi:prepilin-type N-terminal cleavage/methylation domain-containing protein
MKTPRNARGFTLMEVLTAVILVAIVLPVTMAGISLAAGLAGTARHEAEAAALAHSKLNELQATRGWQNGNLSGDFGDAYPEYRWTATLAPWQASALQQLDLQVLWTFRGRERHVDFSTLVDPEAN